MEGLSWVSLFGSSLNDSEYHPDVYGWEAGVGSCIAPFWSPVSTWGWGINKGGRFALVRSLSSQLALHLPFQTPATWRGSLI